jgi:hypothetical protein
VGFGSSEIGGLKFKRHIWMAASSLSIARTSQKSLAMAAENSFNPWQTSILRDQLETHGEDA